MYPLLGFINVLLMLTQSRFTTDLSFVWNEETATTAAKTKFVVPGTFRLPVEKASLLSFDLISPGGKEKLRQVLHTEAKYFLHVQKIKQRNRAIPGSKLYLVFGQLKTEG
jgi:hypothetical protein